MEKKRDALNEGVEVLVAPAGTYQNCTVDTDKWGPLGILGTQVLCLINVYYIMDATRKACVLRWRFLRVLISEAHMISV